MIPRVVSLGGTISIDRGAWFFDLTGELGSEYDVRRGFSVMLRTSKSLIMIVQREERGSDIMGIL